MTSVSGRLSQHVARLAAEVPNKRSAEHSRLTILAAAARLTETRDLVVMRVPEICRACGISRATFYLHFQGRDELFAELMKELTALEGSLTPSLDGCENLQQALARITDWYVDLHLANSSLFRSLTFLRPMNRAIADSWAQRARVIHEALVRELSRFDAFRGLDLDQANFVIEFIGRGMNTLTLDFNTKLPRNPYIPPDLAVVKNAVSEIFCRALFGVGREPKPSAARRAGKRRSGTARPSAP